MKYLTKVLVDKGQVLNKGLVDSYKWHKAIWEAFPGRKDKNRHFLYRVDKKDKEFRIFILSSTEVAVPDWGEWKTKKMSENFLEHDKYRFQIKANPTKRRNSDGRRLGLFTDEALSEWIDRKAERSGFVIESVAIGAPVSETFNKTGRKGKHISVDFNGILSVSDRPSFKKSFRKGIGSAKSFGYGLLMLQPVS